MCLGFGSTAPSLSSSALAGQDPHYPAVPQEFCSSHTFDSGHCSNLEMPTGGFRLGRVGGCFLAAMA